MKTLFRFAMLAAAFAFLMPFAASNANAQNRHPAYIHALADLRDARAHLQHRPDGSPIHAEEKNAIEEINHAIDEIKKAAIDDGKNIDQHEPVDAHLPWSGHLHQARDLLDKAHHDAAQEEDNPTTRGLQARVLQHIDRAHHHVDEALAIAEAH
jgi:hypothetical protein